MPTAFLFLLFKIAEISFLYKNASDKKSEGDFLQYNSKELKSTCPFPNKDCRRSALHIRPRLLTVCRLSRTTSSPPEESAPLKAISSAQAWRKKA